jgi:hypothetical protein
MLGWKRMLIVTPSAQKLRSSHFWTSGMKLLRRGNYRSIRQGFRKLSHSIKGMMKRW